MPPRSGHFMRRVRHALAAKLRCQVFHQSALVVVVEPVLQIMEARKIFTGAHAATVAIGFDVMQKVFRRPVRFRLVQHSRKRERCFKKRPAVEPVEIDRRRLDSIVDLERVRFVTRAGERLPHHGCPLPDRQRFPIVAFGQRNQPIELVLPFENCLERQPRLDRKRRRANQNNGNNKLRSPHSGQN